MSKTLNEWTNCTQTKVEEIKAWAEDVKETSTEWESQPGVLLAIVERNRRVEEIKWVMLHDECIKAGFEILEGGWSDWTPIFLTHAPVGDIYSFPKDVFSYSSILGRVYVELRNALAAGKAHDVAGKWKTGACAELDVLNCKLESLRLFPNPPGKLIEWPSEKTVSRTAGLELIHQTIDLKQDDLVRLRLTGVTIIQGIPGSGKTSIAVMKIPTLLDRQYRAREWNALDTKFMPKTIEQQAAFTASRIVIFIRANHLRNYLYDFCRKHIVSGVQVLKFSSWLLETIRGFCVDLNKREKREFSFQPDIDSDLIP